MVSTRSDQRPPEMHLALEAADRKERLLALRRRKDGETDDTLGPRYALSLFPLLSLSRLLNTFLYSGYSHSFTFRHRNFNPGTRQPVRAAESRPAVVADVETVERRVEGLAERIIADDAVRRMEELVCPPLPAFPHLTACSSLLFAGSVEYRAKEGELGSPKGHGQAHEETRTQDGRSVRDPLP